MRSAVPCTFQPGLLHRRCSRATLVAATTTSSRRSRPVVAAVHAKNQRTDGAATNFGPAALSIQGLAAKAARTAAAATAAALLTTSPALAATDLPSLGPWSFYNMTQYTVALSIEYAPADGCQNQFGGADPGFQFTYPFPRGACKVVNVEATALIPPKQPGGNPTIVASADWGPTDPNSQPYNQWVVMQLLGGPDSKPGSPPNLKVVHIID